MSPIRASQPNIIATRNCGPLFRGSFSGGLVVIIDEIDKHGEVNEVPTRFHGRRNQKTTLDFPVVTIGISNDIEFKGEIESRVQSTLQPEHRTFTPYEEDQLIANPRKSSMDAFYDGVLNDEVIPNHG